MGISRTHLIEQVKGIKAIEAQANTGAAVTGETLDRLGYSEAVLVTNWAVVTGSPSAATTSLVLQHGDASNMSDAATLFTLETAKDIMTAGYAEYHIKLDSAKRYIRLVWDATYTGGSTPGNVLAADAVLGGKYTEPPSTVTVQK